MALATLQTDEAEVAEARWAERNWIQRHPVYRWFMRGRGYWRLRVLSLIVVLGIWEWYGRSSDSLGFAPVSEVAQSFGRFMTQGEFWSSLWITLQSLLWGYGLAVVVGVVLGIVAGWVRIVERLADPYVTVLLSTPLSPAVPVLIVIFGIGLSVRVATVFLFAIAIIIVNVTTAVRSVPENLIEMAKSFGAPRRTLFREVMFPSSLPGIVAGLRLGAGRAVVGMVVSELIIVAVGIGKLLSRYRGRFDAASVLALVVIMLIIGWGVVRIIRIWENRLSEWKR
jgi:NitT/TauT family transport system permease protein